MAELNCLVQGEPKPLLEWILPDGSKVRAPYSSEDRRIVITAEGRLTLRGAGPSDTGIYRCIATNYLDADILVFRVTVLSPDVEEFEVNGVHHSRPLGEDQFFECRSSGSPEASVQWILPDHTILDESYGNREVYENGTLLIKGLTERDRGFYRCLVANHLGVDLLVSQVTVTEDASETVTDLDSDGSGTGMEETNYPSLSEDIVTLSESPSSSPSDRNSQESRTITSDRPYSSFRSQGSDAGQKRKGSVSNRRRLWGNRQFDKASRRVDPVKFAKLMKKVQDGSRVKTATEQETIKYTDAGEIGSGGGQNEDHLIIVPRVAQPTTGQQINVATTEAYQNVGMDTYTLATESYMQSDSPIKATFSNNPRDRSESQIDAVTPYNGISDNTGLSSIDEPSDSNGHAATLHLTVTDSAQETQLQFSGEIPESEMSTSAVTMSPNVTPLKDGSVPVQLFVHIDPESQMTFTAITTTERQKDEITLHTTQTIKSPHLSAGSTIISRQHIHIIPHKNSRGVGRRRSFQGRRRIIKPSRISDVHSFMNKLKKPSVKKEAGVTVPYKTELTTGKQPCFSRKECH